MKIIQLLYISIFYILLHTVVYAEILSVDKVVKTITVEDIKKKSKSEEFNILTAKTLDFEKVNEHQNILFGYGLLEENIKFQQKVVQRSIELYGVDSLMTQISYLYLAFGYQWNYDFTTSEAIYEYVDELKENMNYENNIFLNNELNIRKVQIKLHQKKYNDAKKIILSNLYILKENKKVNTINEYIRSLKYMAMIENYLGNDTKSLEYLMQFKEKKKNNNINFSLDEMIATQILLFKIYENQKNYIKMKDVIQVAYNEIKKSNETLSPLRTIELLSTASTLFLFYEEYTLSKKAAQEALKIQNKFGLKDNWETVIAMVHLGLSELSMGRYKESKKILIQALSKNKYLKHNIKNRQELKVRVNSILTDIKILEELIERKKENESKKQ